MRRITYIYDRLDWPSFTWDSARLAAPLAAVRHRQGRLLGRLDALGFELRAETTLVTLTEDAIKTTEIEGETLDHDQVRSSLARKLGMPTGGVLVHDRRAAAISTVVLDATQQFELPLTAERLFGWHAALFDSPGAGPYQITIGAWRTDRHGPMRVESGRPGRERIYFEAPAAARIPAEMEGFLAWYEMPDPSIDPVLKAAIAHIWFVTIHPFDDGNGRIGRAIADMSLARSEGTSQRSYSMSARLRVERNEYYATLEAAQKGDLDLTPRLAWFIGVLDRALDDAEQTLAATMSKARFWDRLAQTPINNRQRLMLNRLLDGFEGKLTTAKWAQMTKCSPDTALRDIDALIELGILAKGISGGRSTGYVLIAGH